MSHGKGALGVVGSLLKRTADRFVCTGHDLNTFDKFFDLLKTYCSSVLIFKEFDLEKQLFEKFTNLKLNNIKAVPQNNKCHSVVSYKKGIIYYTDLSCLCQDNCICKNKKLTFM